MRGSTLRLNDRKESRSHEQTKMAVMDIIKSSGDSMNVWLMGPLNTTVYTMDLTGVRPVPECAYPSGKSVLDPARFYAEHGCYPSMIFDIGLVDKQGRVVGAFEIVKTHGLDGDKIEKLLDARIFCFELKAFDFNSELELQNPGYVEAFRLVCSQHARQRIRFSNGGACV